MKNAGKRDSRSESTSRCSKSKSKAGSALIAKKTAAKKPAAKKVSSSNGSVSKKRNRIPPDQIKN